MRRQLLAWVMAVMIVGSPFAAAQQPKAATTAATSPASPLAGIIHDLRFSSMQHRADAIRRLEDLGWRRGLSEAECLWAITEATAGAEEREFHPDQYREMDAQAALIEAAATRPLAAGQALIEKHFDRLTPHARTAAMVYLVRLNTPASLDRFLAHFAKHADEWEWPPSLARALGDALPNDRLQAAVIDALGRDRTAEVAIGALLVAVEKGRLPKDHLAAQLGPISAAYRKWIAKLPPLDADKPRTLASRREPKHRETVEVAAGFPVLLGRAGPGAEGVLRETFAAREPWMSVVAIGSLFRVGADVPQAEIDAVAADDEGRIELLRALVQAGKRDRFPKAWLSQEALARSETVRWLTYQNSVGPPDEVVLVRVVDVDTKTEDGVVSAYLFRFRSPGDPVPAKAGWAVGAVGAYRKADLPTARQVARVFTYYERFESKTPDEHARNVTAGVLAACRAEAERRAQEK